MISQHPVVSRQTHAPDRRVFRVEFRRFLIIFRGLSPLALLSLNRSNGSKNIGIVRQTGLCDIEFGQGALVIVFGPKMDVAEREMSLRQIRLQT